MTDITTIMLGPRLKIQRAYSHIDELRRRTSPLDPTLYAFGVETSRPISHPNGPVFELAYRPKKPIPETLALVIGDAIHNLRAALDHLANGIIRTWHPSPPKGKGFFPMGPKRENFITSPHFAPIEEAIPGAKEFLLNQIRPDGGANDHLWAFGSLDNDDKHNLILPTVTFGKVTNVSFTIGGSRVNNAAFGSNAAGPMMFGKSEGVPITVEKDFYVAVDIKFGQGPFFRDEPVIPTLIQFAELTSKTLDLFSPFIREKKGI